MKRRSISCAAAGSFVTSGRIDLQRHHDAQLGVPRLVDRTHAADAEQPHDDVASTELLADVQRTLGRAHGRRRPDANAVAGLGVADARDRLGRRKPTLRVAGAGGQAGRIIGRAIAVARAAVPRGGAGHGARSDEVGGVRVERRGRRGRGNYRVASSAPGTGVRVPATLVGPNRGGLAQRAGTRRLAHAGPAALAMYQKALGGNCAQPSVRASIMAARVRK